MSHRERSVHASAFEEAARFDEQVYRALKRSPWWMISIAAHVLLFVVSSMFQTTAGPATSGPPLVADFDGSADRLDPDPPDKTTPDETVMQRPDVDVQEVPIRAEDVPESDKDRRDLDVPFDDMAGMDGQSDAPFDGRSSNRGIGLLGGPGSQSGHGFGSDRNTKRKGGGTLKQEDALDHALRWLAAHQSPDGSWEAEGFMKWCDGKPAAGSAPDTADRGLAQYDTGVTGLALLAFLGAGHTNRSEGAFGGVVSRGLRWLKNAQDAEGCYGPRSTGHYVYNHAIAALAMVEAYGMTSSGVWRGPAQKGLDFLVMARNPYFAWRYGVKPGDNDTSVTGWMMMALKSAKMINAAASKSGRAAPLVVDEDAFDGIRTWVDKMTDPDTGRVGYQARGSGPARPTDRLDRFPSDKSESMTAVGVLARVFLGENPKASKPVQDGARLCAALPPTWNRADGSIDTYYWYYATLATYQVGGASWKKWEAAMKTAVLDSQRTDGDFCLYKGSWDPQDDVWGRDGGRVYSTAVLAMCLEVWYRYPRVFGASAD